MILNRLLGEQRSQVTNFGHPSGMRWDDVRKFFATPLSSVGVPVTQDTVLGLPALWDGVRQIAQDTAFLPASVVKTTANDIREKVRDHRVSFLLTKQANPLMSGQALRETMGRHLEIYGNGIAEIQRDAMERPMGLWLLHPNDVRVVLDVGSDGYLYVVRRRGGRESNLLPRNVLHVVGPSNNGVVGHDIVQVLYEALGYSLASLRAASRFFANGMRLSGVITIPAAPKKDVREEFERSVKEKYEGPDNTNSTLFLYNGGSYTPISSTLENAKMPEMMQVGVVTIAQVLGIPVYKLKDMSRATWGNVEQMQIDYATATIIPRCKRWENEIERKLFNELEQTDHTFRHNLDGLMRGDFKTRSEALDSGIQTGRYSINEALALDDRNGIGPEGDTRFVPVNLQTLERAIAGPPQPVMNPSTEPDAEEERSMAILDGILCDRMAACIAKEQSRIHEVAVRFAKANDPAGFRSWLDTFYEDHRGALLSAFELPCRLASEAGRKTDVVQLAGLIFERHCALAKGRVLAVLHGTNTMTAAVAVIEETMKPWSDPAYVAGIVAGVWR